MPRFPKRFLCRFGRDRNFIAKSLSDPDREKQPALVVLKWQQKLIKYFRMIGILIGSEKVFSFDHVSCQTIIRTRIKDPGFGFYLKILLRSYLPARVVSVPIGHFSPTRGNH